MEFFCGETRIPPELMSRAISLAGLEVNLVVGLGDPDLTVLIGIPWRKESTCFNDRAPFYIQMASCFKTIQITNHCVRQIER